MSSVCAALLTMAMAACGGGGDSTQADSAAVAAVATDSGTATALGLRSNNSPALADGGTGSSTDNLASTTPAPPSNAQTVGAARALTASASLALAGVIEVPSAAAPLAATGTSGRSFFVDSQSGNDRNDGRSAGAPQASRAGVAGPWKTLARVMQSDLSAGDMLLLACGSRWNETLRLPASGTASQPIVVRAGATDCRSKPTIDGSVTLAASAWSRHDGNIFKTTIAGTPTLIVGAPLVEARHPNPDDTSQSGSPYLSLATDSAVVVRGTHEQSPFLVTGADLKLPAGARIAPGTRVRVRVNAWYIDETTVASADGTRLTLTTPTSYPAKAGWGYMLLGQAWMLDSPGEWFHDAQTGQLYVWMPDSGAPPATLAVATLPVGVDLQGRHHVTVDGIAVARTRLGVDLQRTTAVQWRNGSIEDSAEACLAASGSVSTVIEATQISRCGTEAIQGESNHFVEATGLIARRNVVRDAGVQMSGETALTSPRRIRAAIVAGGTATVMENTVINSGYIGIRIHGGSRVENNFIYGSCSVLDDCAGIYTWSSADVTIKGNVVVRSRGSPSGMAPAERASAAQGIYLDEKTTNALVEGNTVVDADHGIQIHVASHNTIRGNRLFANRVSQIWLQATRNLENPAGDLHDNVITDNQIAPVVPGSVGILMTNPFGPTTAFATIDRNRYADRNAAAVVLESTPAGTRAFSLAQWRGASAAGLPSGRDANGSGISTSGFSSYSIAGESQVPNGNLARGLEGWSTWNASVPYATMLRSSCPLGWCLRVQPGGSSTLVASPNFTVQAGQWYRLAVDLLGENDNQPVSLVVRRGGGAANGYESLSDRPLSTTAGRTWRRHAIVFQAIKTVNFRDQTTGDNGARIDIEGLLAGGAITFANLELVPATVAPAALLTGAVVNAGGADADMACPLPAAQTAWCERLVRLDDNTPIRWPQRVPARSGFLFYGQEPSLADIDEDGIADALDSCAGTAAGTVVNAAGCGMPGA